MAVPFRRSEQGAHLIELLVALGLLLSLLVPVFLQAICLVQAQALAVHTAQEVSLQTAKPGPGPGADATAAWAAMGWLDQIEGPFDESIGGLPAKRVTVWVRVRKVGPFTLVKGPFRVKATAVSAVRM